jgi:hypothetical protein
MHKAFKHPLARNATTARQRRRQGEDETVLVIVTTMDLDPNSKAYSRKNFERLDDAAKTYLAEAADVAGYVIVNRVKEWRD